MALDVIRLADAAVLGGDRTGKPGIGKDDHAGLFDLGA